MHSQKRNTPLKCKKGKVLELLKKQEYVPRNPVANKLKERVGKKKWKILIERTKTLGIGETLRKEGGRDF